MNVTNAQPANTIQQLGSDKIGNGAAAIKADAASTLPKAADRVDFSKVGQNGVGLDAPQQASQERVAKLKALIESGSYHVPALEIASKMISFASRA